MPEEPEAEDKQESEGEEGDSDQDSDATQKIVPPRALKAGEKAVGGPWPKRAQEKRVLPSRMPPSKPPKKRSRRNQGLAAEEQE